jgi:DNA repair protein RadC
MAKTITIKTFSVSVAVEGERPEYILSSQDAYRLLRPIFQGLDMHQEHVIALALDGTKQVLGYKVICSGKKDASEIDLRLLFRALLVFDASQFILAHNHTSDYSHGAVVASPDDKTVTVRIAKAADMIGIRLVDHLILSADLSQFYAFSEHHRS